MATSGYRHSGPAREYAATYQTSGGASLLPPPYQPNIIGSGDATMHNSAHDAERRPLLSQPKRDSEPPIACVSLTVLFLILFLLCPTYLLYSSNFYKEMYEGVRVRIQHLEQENAALERETYDLQTKLHELREHLMDAKVSAFWEIARTIDTNMDVWVGADDPGVGPKFWSYGITNGRYNDNHPPITSVKLDFSADQAATAVSTEQHRIIGYKVESNRYNNGWWMATGLNEFGEGGSPEVTFRAKDARNGAWYEVVVFYADWKPSEEREVLLRLD